MSKALVPSKEKGEVDVWASKFGISSAELNEIIINNAILDAKNSLENGYKDDFSLSQNPVKTEKGEIDIQMIRQMTLYTKIFQKYVASNTLTLNFQRILDVLLTEILSEESKNKIQAIETFMKILDKGIDPEAMKQMPNINLNFNMTKGESRASILDNV